MNVLSCGELKNASENGANIVDVREPMELLSGKLLDAVNIPMRALARIVEMFEPEDEILVYCRTGHRSSYAESMLKNMGYSNVKNIGGIVHYRECLVTGG